MHRRSSGDDEPVREQRTDPESAASTPPALEADVVTYETRPDRQTIYPSDCTEDRKLTAWLSANTSAFVDLGDRR